VPRRRGRHLHVHPISYKPVAGTQHQVGDSFTNDSTVQSDYSLTRKDTVGTTDSVNISSTVKVTLFKVVDLSITAAYGHTWTTSHEFDETIRPTCRRRPRSGSRTARR